MKNSDMPINPIFNLEGLPTNKYSIEDGDAYGLTKREYFAGLAMQGELASQTETTFYRNDRMAAAANKAVKAADALLEELNKPVE